MTKLRLIILGLLAASGAGAQTAPTAAQPVANAASPAKSAPPTLSAASPTTPSAAHAIATAASATASNPARTIPPVDETGQVPLDCDKRLGAYQFAKQRYEAKVKIGIQTWEDVANYHSTRADWLECVANGQYEAIKAERRARNEVIAQLNAVNTQQGQLNDAIVGAQEQFAQCDKAPIPTDLAATTCGPETFVHTCSQNTVRRLFARENGRSEGPRAHLLRSVLQQSLSRRASLLQCVVDHVDPVETVTPTPVHAAPMAQKTVNH